MTLDEAIKHAEEKAAELIEQAEQLRDIGEALSNPKQPYNEPVKACRDCAEEHRQLAEWLKELKRLRNRTVEEKEPPTVKIGDEVIVDGCKGIIIREPYQIGNPDDPSILVLVWYGSYMGDAELKAVEPTGKTYPEIEKIIEQLKYDSDEVKPFVKVTFDKEELNRIVDERVIKAIENGELVITSKWIPVSEKLPKERINPNTNDFEFVMCSTIWDDVRFYKFGKPIGEDKAHFWDYGSIMDEYIIAWMYLPESYKKEEDMSDKKMFIIESDKAIYSVCASDEEEAKIIFEDFKDKGERFERIREELSKKSYAFDKMK